MHIQISAIVQSVMRICLINGVLACKGPRQIWMSRHIWMLGWEYFHWPIDTRLIYYLRNLWFWALSSILTLSFMMTLMCKLINVPGYIITGTGLYIDSWWIPRLGQVTHWVMCSRILESWIKFTVETRWNKSIQMQSLWSRPISITFMFLPLSHNRNGRTRTKTRP